MHIPDLKDILSETQVAQGCAATLIKGSLVKNLPSCTKPDEYDLRHLSFDP